MLFTVVLDGARLQCSTKEALARFRRIKKKYNISGGIVSRHIVGIFDKAKGAPIDGSSASALTNFCSQ